MNFTQHPASVELLPSALFSWFSQLYHKSSEQFKLTLNAPIRFPWLTRFLPVKTWKHYTIEIFTFIKTNCCQLAQMPRPEVIIINNNFFKKYIFNNIITFKYPACLMPTPEAVIVQSPAKYPSRTWWLLMAICYAQGNFLWFDDIYMNLCIGLKLVFCNLLVTCVCQRVSTLGMSLYDLQILGSLPCHSRIPLG